MAISLVCRASERFSGCLRKGSLAQVWARCSATLSPGLRVYDPEDPTTALHKKYHDLTLQYTMDNLEWVEQKKYSNESVAVEKQAALRAASRARLWRWPRLSEEDTQPYQFADRPQRFCPKGDTTLGDPGEHVFVVNLARRPEKLRRAVEQLAAARLSATVVTAVDGDALEAQSDLDELGVRVYAGYNGFSNHNMPFTTGEVGCFMSHYTIWHRMVEHNIPSALILEDDFDLQEDFQARLGGCLEEARGLDWNLFYVGRSPMENDIRHISPHVVQPGYTLWTVGYILRLDGAKRLLESRAERHMLPLDDFFSISMGCGKDGLYNERAAEWSSQVPTIFRALGAHPPLVMPYVGSMFLSDTAMLRPRTRFVKDLPVSGTRALRNPGIPQGARSGMAAGPRAPTDAPRPPPPGMPSAWWEALQLIQPEK